MKNYTLYAADCQIRLPHFHIGDHAKLMFLPTKPDNDHQPESMWVEIEKQKDDMTFVGRLKSEPIATDINYKAKVRFGIENIIETLPRRVGTCC